jgi:hypothetical protein
MGDERAWWARHGIFEPIMLANHHWPSRINDVGGIRHRPFAAFDAELRPCPDPQRSRSSV